MTSTKETGQTFTYLRGAGRSYVPVRQNGNQPPMEMSAISVRPRNEVVGAKPISGPKLVKALRTTEAWANSDDRTVYTLWAMAKRAADCRALR